MGLKQTQRTKESGTETEALNKFKKGYQPGTIFIKEKDG
jgi:hypothetical protein